MALAPTAPRPASDDGARTERNSALVMRNISVLGRRTSIRLEPQIWDTLAEICRREYCTTQDVCSYVAKHRRGSLASSLRVFILGYFHASATEAGHRNAGHGQGMFLLQQEERQRMRKVKADGEPDGLDCDALRARSGSV
jgi:predicted DNA-binding ribbon-helix-helix protein